MSVHPYTIIHKFTTYVKRKILENIFQKRLDISPVHRYTYIQGSPLSPVVGEGMFNMATDMKRFTLTVTPEIEQGVEELKQSDFYNRPYSELYRHIINAGVSAIKNGEYKQKDTQNATA